MIAAVSNFTFLRMEASVGRVAKWAKSVENMNVVVIQSWMAFGLCFLLQPVKQMLCVGATTEFTPGWPG